MMTTRGRIRVNWGHLALLATIACIVVAYLTDTRETSLRVTNLILVQPVAILALALLLLVIPQCFHVERESAGEESAERPASSETMADLARIMVMIAAFITLAFSLETVGFDVAVFAFLVLGIYVCGERNWLANLLFSAVFTVLLIYGYGAIIPFPFPLAVL
jgi:hypothetical protein